MTFRPIFGSGGIEGDFGIISFQTETGITKIKFCNPGLMSLFCVFCPRQIQLLVLKHAAVNIQGLTRDIHRSFGDQKHNGPTDVLNGLLSS